MITSAELEVLERRRHSSSGASRASAAVLLQRDRDGALVHLQAEEQELTSFLRRSLPFDPKRFGFSPCGFAYLASCRFLTRPPTERGLEELAIAFAPPFSTTEFSGCGAGARELGLALLAFLQGDRPVAARHLIPCRTDNLPDQLLAQTLSLLCRSRGHQVPEQLEKLAPQYKTAMAEGLWKQDPEAFFHYRLLAALAAGAEQGLVELTALPDVIPYVPVWMLRPAHVIALE